MMKVRQTARYVALAGALLLLLVAVGTVYYLYERFIDAPSIVREDDGRAITRIVDARLAAAVDLRVSRLSGTVQAVATDRRWGGWLNSSYVMKAPFSVSYFIDLSKLDRGDFLWNAESRTLTVTVPDVRPEPADIDETRTTVSRTDGIIVTRDAMTVLRQRASRNAVRVAGEEAVKPARLGVARANGRAAVTSLFQRPLRVAGMDATVRVRFTGEPEQDGERMDRSRTLAEIYAEMTGKR
ncbi:DUF4230 domain-containing protein [Sphingomonas solaris]|uniref:DUF4230 domain-containing protein n=1 Tax=Alterirhizorhabdus solaris TaxID=2529389 RepID=A0A558QYY6_9SPHN|nr:DUF4230 domain-containing protein [Sphingomonas solaris]TVV72350.1 DUF4230 domain-containing protein [Sphingomonas solaris]